jgi:hypothetical protein
MKMINGKSHDYILLFLFFFSLTSFNSGNDKQKILGLIKDTKKNYDNLQNYEISMEYSLYSTYNSMLVTEAYSGIMSKKKDIFYSKIGTTEFFRDTNYFIKIDHKSKAMEYSYKENDSYKFYNMLDKYLDYFSKFELTSDKNIWICTLSAPEVSLVPYSKIVFHIDKNTSLIKKQILYFLVENKYKNAKGEIKTDFPRLEIITGITNNAVPANKFSIKNYVSINKGKVSPAGQLKNYKIIDLTK